MGEPELFRALRSSGSLGNIRRATHNDLHWMIELIQSSYRGTIYAIEPHDTLLMGLQCLKSPNWLMLRGDRSVGMAFCDSHSFNTSVKRGHCYLLASHKGSDWEPYNMLKYMVGWAKQQGCVRFDASEETEFSLQPFLKRLGFKVQKPTYELELETVH